MSKKHPNNVEWVNIELPEHIYWALEEIREEEKLETIDEAIRLILIRA